MSVALADEEPDGPAVAAILAAIRTLTPAAKERLLRRLIDALHLERQQDQEFLSVEMQRDLRLIAAVRSVADSIGHAPSSTEYIASYRVARGRGDSSLPSIATLLKRFRTWKATLFAAGLTGSPPRNLISQRRLHRPRPAHYPDARVTGCLRACAADLDRVPSVRDYDAWREQKRRDAIASGRVWADAPHSRTARDRFGSWADALRAAGLDGRLDHRNPPEWWTPLEPNL